MRTYTFSFATIILHEEDLAEIIVHEGVEMNVDLVEKVYQFLLSNLKTPISLLFNRLHSYSYSFEAQQYMGILPQIRAIAQVAYGPRSTQIAEFITKVSGKSHGNIRIFNAYEVALQWLKNQ